MTDIEQKALALVEECSEYGALYRNYREVPNSVFHKALCRAADRIEALEAENERLRGALEQFLALIKHQYFGSREAMNDLQEADNAARAALGEKQ